MENFSVTYKIVTEESAEYGDAEERGYISESCSLRDAVAYIFESRTSHCGGIETIEANEHPIVNPRWLTVYNGREFLTGAQESRSIHFPDHLTAATRRRLCRLLTY